MLYTATIQFNPDDVVSIHAVRVHDLHNQINEELERRRFKPLSIDDLERILYNRKDLSKRLKNLQSMFQLSKFNIRTLEKGLYVANVDGHARLFDYRQFEQKVE